MVVILVLLTIAAFIVVDLVIVERRARRSAPSLAAARPAAAAGLAPSLEPAATGAAMPPEPTAPRHGADLFFHPGHTWARRSLEGIVEVGADAFAARLAGALSALELPARGARIRQGEPAMTLVSARGRRLSLAMPVDGEVVLVNEALSADPTLVGRSPYEAGWTLLVRPDRLRASLANLMREGAARAWLDAIKSRVTTRVAAPLGALATDGGEWDVGFGDRLDDTAWDAVRRDLFPAAEPPASPTPDEEWR